MDKRTVLLSKVWLVKFSENVTLNQIYQTTVPSLQLWSYLKGKSDLSKPTLRMILHSHFQERSELHNQFTTEVQGNKETLQNFLIRAMDLKQKILSACLSQELRTFGAHSRCLLLEWDKPEEDENGVLWRKTHRKQLVLPDKTKLLHERRYVTRWGYDRTVSLMRDRFFWPYMQHEIEQY